MELLPAKLLAAAVLAAVCLLAGLAAFSFHRKVLRHSARPMLTSLLVCGGGGGLLATSLLQLLPAVRAGLQQDNARFSLAFLPELVLCSGFLLVYLVEEAVQLLGRRVAPQPAPPTEPGRDSEVEQDQQAGQPASYNPKYEVRLSNSTNTMFPNYHAPDSMVPPSAPEMLAASSEDKTNGRQEELTGDCCSVHQFFTG